MRKLRKLVHSLTREKVEMPIRTMGRKPGKGPKHFEGRDRKGKSSENHEMRKDVVVEPSSRLFVSNLPKFIKETALQETFERFGPVTDVKIMKDASGNSRKFGFIGFRSIEESKRAKDKLNKSFINTSRIQVQFAAPYGAQSQPKPWSKHSKIPKAVPHDSTKKNSSTSEPKKPDAEFQEFLSVSLPSANKETRKFWGNDDGTIPEMDKAESENKTETRFDESAGESDDEDYQDMGKISGSIQEEPFEDDFLNEEPEDDAIDAIFQDAPEDVETSPQTLHDREDASNEVPDLSDTGRLFVRNLPFTATEEDLHQHFGKFGEIDELKIPLDDLQRSKGYAFVQYKYPEHAVAALGALDGEIYLGRLLHILPAKLSLQPKEVSAESEGFKEKKENELKELTKRPDIWNTLFIRSDSAVSSIANKFGVDKSEIVDPHSDSLVSLPVRVALAETQVVAETKSFLEENGVAIDAFEKRERSKNTILVKNLPASTDAIELRRLFGRFGTLGRFLLSPSAVLCIIEFMENSQASKAFKSLSYKKFKHAPLYLEWAPLNVFKQSQASAPLTDPSISMEIESIDTSSESGSTLFVKNLNFKTDEAALEKVFKKVGALRNVTIVTRKHERTQAAMSTGYGFVEFSDPQAAVEALKTLQRVQVDGHLLDLRVARSVSSEEYTGTKRKASSKTKSTSKLIVKNLPFQANQKELKSLFGTFGQIKTCRIPKKVGGNHRGFAFIEFLTANEANSAMTALQNTHFYGRHLVLEWANQEDTLEDVRTKTMKTFHESRN